MVRYHGVQRICWAKLLARGFRYDVTVRSRCSGHMKVIAALTEPAAIQAFLTAVALPPGEFSVFIAPDDVPDDVTDGVARWHWIRLFRRS